MIREDKFLKELAERGKPNEPKPKRGRPRKYEVRMQGSTGIRLNQPLFGAVKRISERQDRTFADIVKEALFDYLIRYVPIEDIVSYRDKPIQPSVVRVTAMNVGQVEEQVEEQAEQTEQVEE